MKPPFVPAQQPEAAQRAAQQCAFAALLADSQRRRQRAIGGVEPLEQRREIPLPQVDLGEPRRSLFASEVRDQRSMICCWRARRPSVSHTRSWCSSRSRSIGMPVRQPPGPLDHARRASPARRRIGSSRWPARRRGGRSEPPRPSLPPGEMTRQERRALVDPSRHSTPAPGRRRRAAFCAVPTRLS